MNINVMPFSPLLLSVRVHPNGQSYINFKDAKALRELTRCLLDKDFGIKVVLPEDRLCPTVRVSFSVVRREACC